MDTFPSAPSNNTMHRVESFLSGTDAVSFLRSIQFDTAQNFRGGGVIRARS